MHNREWPEITEITIAEYVAFPHALAQCALSLPGIVMRLLIVMLALFAGVGAAASIYVTAAPDLGEPCGHC